MKLHFYNKTKKIMVLEDGNFSQYTSDEDFNNQVIIINDPCCQNLSVAMPVKQAKQIIKALPFALEEQLANDIDMNHIQYIGRQDADAFALVIDTQLMDFITQEYEPTSLQYLPLLLPEIEQGICVCILDGIASIRYSKLGTLSVNAEILTLVLEKLKQVDKNIIEFYDLDNKYELLPLEIENLGFEMNKPDNKNILDCIKKASSSYSWDLLTGAYTKKKPKQQTKHSKLKAPLSIAAALIVIVFCTQLIQMKQYRQMSDLVGQASKDFYNVLFPGETIRSLRRQFKDKLEEGGAGPTQSAGFTSLLFSVTKHASVIKNIEWDGVRFTRQKNELEINLIVDNIAQLDELKQKMTTDGLMVDISSATNTGNRIKGVLKVTKNG